MGKRCEIIINGEPCPYLAEDGTCLLSENELNEKCPAREREGHEEKDEWMLEEIRPEDVDETVKNVLGDK